MFISVVWKYFFYWFIVNIYTFCCALVWDVEIRRVDAEQKTYSTADDKTVTDDETITDDENSTDDESTTGDTEASFPGM